jgi:hypothetical protein
MADDYYAGEDVANLEHQGNIRFANAAPLAAPAVSGATHPAQARTSG